MGNNGKRQGFLNENSFESVKKEDYLFQKSFLILTYDYHGFRKVLYIKDS